MISIYEILNIVIYGLMIFLLFILLIVVAVKTMKEELRPDCKKGFSKFFIAFLLFIMFSKVFMFANNLTYTIFIELEYPLSSLAIVLLITSILGLLNQGVANILLFISMEIYLFNKKSKWKFGILVLILQFGSFLLFIIKIFLPGLFGSYLGYFINFLIVDILRALNFIIIGIAIIILLRKTAKVNDFLREYTKLISVGVILLFIIVPIFGQLMAIISFIINLYVYPDPNLIMINIFGWIFMGLFILSSLISMIGMVVLSVGALKTMSVLLTFSKQKGVIKKIQRKVANSCSECGAPIPAGAEFCTNCGHHF